MAEPKGGVSGSMERFNGAYARFCDLLTLAEEYMAAGDLSAAAGLAHVAARYAFPGHVGLFASPRLEKLLLDIGRQIPASSACNANRLDKNSKNILHVLSYAQPIGGDSRLAWRWMQEDRSHRHSVAITTQADLNGKYEIPEGIRQAAENSGGFLRALSMPTSKPVEQARELRGLCQDMDIVVLHLYPYDIVPVIALAAGCDSVKTLFINHADHTFWVGASVAHSIVHLRKQRPEFLVNRRGLNPNRSSLLPVPLAYSPPSVTQEQAKRALGYGPDIVVLLTIATPFKYSAPGGIDFLDLVTPVIMQFPKTVLVAVGPSPEGDWRSAHIQTNGRIVARGKRWDNDLLYAAADVYLDSVPFSSTTSLLEAGSRGVPLLGYRSPNHELGLLGPGAPGFDNAMELASDPESYRALLTRLVSDAQFRQQSGQRVRRQILSLHTGKGWIQAVQDVYAKVEQSPDRGCLMNDTDAFDASGLNSALVHLYGDHPFNVRKLIEYYIGALPYRARCSITWLLHRKGFDLSFVNLVPPPMDTMIRRSGRWAKRVIRRFPRFR